MNPIAALVRNERLRHSVLLAALVLVLTGVVTAASLNFSKEHGKLSAVPLYDDCVYLLKSANLVEHLKKGEPMKGIPELIHSPFSVLLAAGAYLVFGYEDFAPYLANGLIVLMCLLFLVCLLRTLPLSAIFPLLCFYACFPILALAVLEFRPDVAWGILAGAMGVLLVTSRDLFQSWGKSILAGGLLAACLLTKPSTFAMTCVIFLGGTAAYFLIARAAGRNAKWLMISARGVIISIGTTVLLALPYFLHEGDHIWEYFLIHTFGQHKELWKYEGDVWAQINYYISGWGGSINLGAAGFVLLVWVVAGLWVLFRRANWEDRCRGIFGLLLVVGVYSVNSIAAHKSIFLGSAIYGSLLFFSAWLIAQIWIHLAKAHKSLVLLWWASAVLAFTFFQWPSNSRVDAHLASHYRRMHQEAYHQIKEAAGERANPSILILQPGPVIPEVLSLWAVRDGTHLNLISGGYIVSEESLRKELFLAEFILTQRPGILGSHTYTPMEDLLPLANQILEGNPSFVLLGSIKIEGEEALYFYRRSW